MQQISSISEIPFHEADLIELLNLYGPPEDRDEDFYGFGYGRADSICLTARGAREPLPIVRNALILALHAADEPEPLSDDIELEFYLDEFTDPDDEEDDYAVTVLLSKFLDVWLPQVSGAESAIVLAVCNPLRATIARPAVCAGTPIYYGQGDVVSFIEGAGMNAFFSLSADEWRVL